MEKLLNNKEKRHFWIQKIEEAKSFNGSHLEFCHQQKINPGNFYGWKSQLKKEAQIKEELSKKLPSKKAFVNAIITNTPPSVNPEKDQFFPDPKWAAEFVSHLFLRMKP